MAHQLAEARETKLVRFAADGGSTTRRAYFIKPVAKLADLQAAGISPAPPLPDDDPPSRVFYRGWLRPLRRWATWVEKMEQLHGQEWDAVGIRGAIMASTFKIGGQPDMMSLLVQRLWCVETNTFVFPWGEVTLTLEDVAVLGGLPLLGQPAVRPPGPVAGRLAALEDKMHWDLKVLNSTAARKALHSGWLKLYVDWNGAGGDGQVEHAAFLSVWLSRFVFPGPGIGTIGRHVFPLAVRLASGIRLALAPAVLASLYRDMRLIKKHAAEDHGTDGGAVVWAPFQLLQMWMWERFPALMPVAGPHFLQPHQPWAARWHNLEATPPDPVRGRDFRWRPYADGAQGCRAATSPPFYPAVGRWVDGSSEGDEAVLSFSRCLAPSMLMGFDCTEQYLPHRVAMQLGYDQDIPGALPNPNPFSNHPWFIYDKPLDKVRFYLPSMLTQPHYTTQYRRWRRNHDRIPAPTAPPNTGAPAEAVLPRLPAAAPRHVPLQKETTSKIKSFLQGSCSSMHGMQYCLPPDQIPAIIYPTAEGVRESATNSTTTTTPVAVPTTAAELEPLAIVLGQEEPLAVWVPSQKRKAEGQMEAPSSLSSVTKKYGSSAASPPAPAPVILWGSISTAVGATASNPLVIDDVDDGARDEGVTRARTRSSEGELAADGGGGGGGGGASSQEMMREIRSRVGKLEAEIAVLREKLAHQNGSELTSVSLG